MCCLPERYPVRNTEEYMRYLNFAASLAILSGTFAFTAVSASAEGTDNLAGCASMQQQVKSALDSNAQSPNYHSAVKEQRYGLEFCSQGLYRNGVSHYAEALKLLSAQQG